jgi:hypothetical protein
VGQAALEAATAAPLQGRSVGSSRADVPLGGVQEGVEVREGPAPGRTARERGVSDDGHGRVRDRIMGLSYATRVPLTRFCIAAGFDGKNQRVETVETGVRSRLCPPVRTHCVRRATGEFPRQGDGAGQDMKGFR